MDKSLITIVTISFLLFFPLNIYSKTFISFVYLQIYINSHKHEFHFKFSVKQFTCETVVRIHIEGHAYMYMYIFLLPFLSFSIICTSASLRRQNHTLSVFIRNPRGQELLIFGNHNPSRPSLDFDLRSSERGRVQVLFSPPSISYSRVILF